MNNSLIKQSPKFPARIRAKKALEVFGNTGSGLSALNEFVFPGTNGGLGSSTSGGFGWLSVAPRNFDYGKVNAYNSSIVMGCINYIIGAFREATPQVSKFDKTGMEIVVQNHKFVKFLRKPNPYYNFTKLMTATLISFYLDGNAYWFKERGDGGAGQTRALYYIPHYQLTPKSEGGSYITYYEYNVNGKTYRIPRERIVHFRNGLDPYNPLSGRKILHPVMSEIFTDEEAARFIAALVRNTGIPGVVITPDTEKTEVTDDDAEMLKENFKRKFGGDNRGEVLVMNFAAKISQMGFNPEQLQFKETRRLPEERTCSQFRLPPIVAGMGAGLDRATYSNYEQAETQAYRSCLVPLWEEMGEELETQLLPEFTGGDADYIFNFSYAKVRALQESQNELTGRVRGLWTVDLLLRSEARGNLNYEVDESRDNVFFSETRPKQGLPQPNPLKRLVEKAKYLLKAGDTEDNLNAALEMSQEAEIKASIDQMEKDLDNLFLQLAQAAENEAKANLDPYNSANEAERITFTIFKALGVALTLRAVWGAMGKAVEDEGISSVSLRLGIPSGEFWGEDGKNTLKSLLLDQARSFESSLTEQTKRAIQIAIQQAETGASVAQIGKAIKSLVSGGEMYPGVFKDAFDKAKEAGATEAQATRAAESKVRHYRAKLIAETENRNFQNQTSLEGYEKAGVEKVKVRDGDGCGWKEHNDEDLAHNSVRLVAEAKKYTLAHPNCQRRFYPVKK